MEGFLHFLIQLKTSYLGFISMLMEVGRMLQPTFKKLILLMVGGGLGAIARYSISILAAKAWGSQFPWGTMIVNLLGCFLIGLLVAFADRGRFLTPETRLLLITGFLGALTTFSTFALETVTAGRAGMTLQPMVNILINNVGGISLTMLGFWIGNQT